MQNLTLAGFGSVSTNITEVTNHSLHKSYQLFVAQQGLLPATSGIDKLAGTPCGCWGDFWASEKALFSQMPLCTHLNFQQKWLKYRRGFKRIPSNTSPHLEWNLCQKTYTSCLSMHGCEFSGYIDWNLFIILVFKRWRKDRDVQMRHKLPKLITGLAETGVQNVFRIWISKHTTRWNIIVRLSWIGLFFTMIDVSTNYAIVIS